MRKGNMATDQAATKCEVEIRLGSISPVYAMKDAFSAILGPLAILTRLGKYTYKMSLIRCRTSVSRKLEIYLRT